MWICSVVHLESTPSIRLSSGSKTMVIAHAAAPIDVGEIMPLKIIAHGNIANALRHYCQGDALRVSGELTACRWNHVESGDQPIYQLTLDAMCGVRGGVPVLAGGVG